MNEITTPPVDDEAAAAPAKPGLAARLRFLGVLIIIIAGLWLVVHFLVPKPFTGALPILHQRDAQVLPVMPQPLQQSPANPEPDAVPESELPMVVEPLAEPAPVPTDTPAPLADDAQHAEAVSEDAAIDVPPIGAEEIVNEQVLQAIAEAEKLADAPQRAQADAVPATPAATPEAAIAQAAGDALDKDARIARLQCALELEREQANAVLLKLIVQKCYAVLLSSGVSQGDIYALQTMDAPRLPDAAMLDASFRKATALALKTSEQHYVQESDWYVAVKRWMGSVLTIRKTGFLQGDSIEAKIARAEFYAGKADFAQAKAEIHSLPDAARAAFKPWLDQVAIRQAYQRIGDALAHQDARQP